MHSRCHRRFPSRKGLVCPALCSFWGLMGHQALAHQGKGVMGGFFSGFTHPIFGFDHLLAMLAVGIWGAQIGGKAVWELPVLFPMVMAFGGALGVAGVHIPFVEVVIALSVISLGGAIAVEAKPPEWFSLVLVGIFAVFHGYAHGLELPRAADPVSYGIGFVTATGLIHLAGIGFGLSLGALKKGRIARATGALFALVGVYFVTAALS